MSISVYRAPRRRTVASSFGNHDGRQTRRSVDLAIAEARIRLAACRGPTQLLHVFVNLTQARCAHRFATCETSAVGVDREAPAYFCFTVGDHAFLLAIRTKSVFRHVH